MIRPYSILPKLGILLAVVISQPGLAETPLLLDQAVKPNVHHARTDVSKGSFETLPDGTWKITPVPAGSPSNPLRLVLPVTSTVAAGERLLLECELRTTNAAATPGQAGVVVDLLATRFDPADPGKAPLFRHVLLGSPQWKTLRVPVEINDPLKANESSVVLSTSYLREPVELRNLKLRNMAKDEAVVPAICYPGQEADASWRKLAAERIARHRMGDFTLRVTDPLGKPATDAKVSLRQKRHAYLFGTCVNAARLTDADIKFRDAQMTRERFLKDNIRYREELLRLFNFVVFENDLKWPNWAGAKPGTSQPMIFDAIRWLHAHDLPIKGHTVLWASWTNSPAWLRSLEKDPAALQAAILRHIRDVGTATAAHTEWWDVLNEPMSHRDIIELLGHDAVAEWFKAARESLPGCKLVLNDFDLVGNGGNAQRRAGFLNLVRDLKQAGAAPDTLGFQSHFWGDRLTPPGTIWEVCDEMHKATGLPLMSSEFDTNFPNDAVQADYTRDFLTAWFSHPATESFIMWGFWGGSHWFGDRGAMFRKDWTPKPNLKAYTDLVFRDWWTNAEGETDADGTWKSRAFLGNYELSVEAPGCQRVFRLPVVEKSGTTLEVILHPAKAAE